jgi:sRNA-binding protein
MAFGEMLYTAFPKTFIHPSLRGRVVKPLKVGIGKEIRALYPDVDEKVVDGFMQFYVSSPPYLKAVAMMGTFRVGLDGEPTGMVDHAQSVGAEKVLEANPPRRKKDSATVGSPGRYCAASGKIRYASAFEAAQAAERLSKRVKGPGGFRAFLCQDCGNYHWGKA